MQRPPQRNGTARAFHLTTLIITLSVGGVCPIFAAGAPAGPTSLLGTAPGEASDSPYIIHHWTRDDGLPQNSANSVIQDSIRSCERVVSVASTTV